MSRLRIESYSNFEHGHLVEPLTALFHRAYSSLAANGMNYLASYQDVGTTFERLNSGVSYVGFLGDICVGSITLCPPNPSSLCEWYRKPEVYNFGQFAIEPEYQGRGFGRQLLDSVERTAAEFGAKSIALDTSERAIQLIETYSRRGYEVVGGVQWTTTNYRSVVMSKVLPEPMKKSNSGTRFEPRHKI